MDPIEHSFYPKPHNQAYNLRESNRIEMTMLKPNLLNLKSFHWCLSSLTRNQPLTFLPRISSLPRQMEKVSTLMVGEPGSDMACLCVFNKDTQLLNMDHMGGNHSPINSCFVAITQTDSKPQVGSNFQQGCPTHLRRNHAKEVFGWNRKPTAWNNCYHLMIPKDLKRGLCFPRSVPGQGLYLQIYRGNAGKVERGVSMLQYLKSTSYLGYLKGSLKVYPDFLLVDGSGIRYVLWTIDCLGFADQTSYP